MVVLRRPIRRHLLKESHHHLRESVEEQEQERRKLRLKNKRQKCLSVELSVLCGASVVPTDSLTRKRQFACREELKLEKTHIQSRFNLLLSLELSNLPCSYSR